MATEEPGGSPGEAIEELRRRLAESEQRCRALEAEVAALEGERSELRVRLQRLLGLLEDAARS